MTFLPPGTQKNGRYRRYNPTLPTGTQTGRFPDKRGAAGAARDTHLQVRAESAGHAARAHHRRHHPWRRYLTTRLLLV